MNIFVLDIDPAVAASYHCDKHVVKMILESAQLLCTAHRILDGKLTLNGKKKSYVLPDAREQLFYKTTHQNHPSAIWCRQTSANYTWLVSLLRNLCAEYTYRYGKVHKCEQIGLVDALSALPTGIVIDERTPFAQAMPDDCKNIDAVQAYRDYYRKHKTGIATWNKTRPAPDWYSVA